MAQKNFVTLVNDAIDEAGVDLASFAADGTDFLTNTDPMLNRFKKWVNRAWRWIQQESFDWEWMSSQAVVNITPGIMFYTQVPITWGPAALNPAVLYDSDIQPIKDLVVSSVVALPQPNNTNLGYVNIETPEPIEFKMKSGAYTISADLSSNKVLRFRFVGRGDRLPKKNSAVKEFIVQAPGLADGDPVIERRFAVTGGYISSVYVGREYGPITLDGTSVYEVTFTQVEAGFYEYLMSESARQTDQDKYELGVGFEFFNDTYTDGPWFSYIGYIARRKGTLSGMAVAISPLNYQLTWRCINIENVENYNFPMAIGSWRGMFTDAPNTTPYYSTGALAGKVVTSDYNVDIGFYEMTAIITDDVCTALSPAAAPHMPNIPISLFTYMLMSQSYSSAVPGSMDTDSFSLYGATFGTPGINRPDPNPPSTGPISVFVHIKDTDTPSGGPFSWHYLVDPQVTLRVHSWKSFDWEEESENSPNFVKDIREIDCKTFRIIHPDEEQGISEQPLQWVPWSTFQNQYDLASVTPSVPRYISEDNTGRWQLYPPADQKYTVLFNYVRQPLELVNWDDIAYGLPEEYEDMLIWKAMQFYGEFDEQPSVAQRGLRNYKQMLSRFEQMARPKFYFKAKRLY